MIISFLVFLFSVCTVFVLHTQRSTKGSGSITEAAADHRGPNQLSCLLPTWAEPVCAAQGKGRAGRGAAIGCTFVFSEKEQKTQRTIQKAVRKLQAAPEWALIPHSVSCWAVTPLSRLPRQCQEHKYTSKCSHTRKMQCCIARQQVWAPPVQLSRNPLTGSVFLHSAQMPPMCCKIRCFQFFFLWQLLRSSAVWRKPSTGNPFLSYDWTCCCKWRACQKAGILQHVHWGTPSSIAAGGRVVTVASWWLALVGTSEECEGSRVESL